MKWVSLWFFFLNDTVYHSMYTVTDSVHVSNIQISIYRLVIIWLETMFTACWFRFLHAVWHFKLFTWLNCCPVVKRCLLFGNLNIDLYSICIMFRCILWVQNACERICLENRCWSSAGIILKKSSSCILTRRASRTRKLIKVAHIL